MKIATVAAVAIAVLIPTAFSINLQVRKTPKRYIKCNKGDHAKVVQACLPFTGGKKQEIWACCSETNGVSLSGYFDDTSTGCADGRLLSCIQDTGGISPNIYPFDASLYSACVLGSKPCGDPPGIMCCKGDPYMPTKAKDKCHFLDQPLCAKQGPPRRRGLGSRSSQNLASRDPPWAQLGDDGQNGVWGDWEKHSVVSVQTVFKTSTSMMTDWVSPTHKTTASPTTTHSTSSYTSTPPTPAFTAYDKQPTVEVHTTGVVPSCTPRVPTTGTAMTQPTSFVIRLGLANDTTQQPDLLSMPHGICAFCKEAARAGFVNIRRFGWSKQQYHDAACCGFPFDLNDGTEWDC